MDDKLAEALVAAVRELVNETKPNPIEYLFGPAFATFLGAMFAFWVAAYQSKLARKLAAARRLALELREAIAKTHEKCVEYWSCSQSELVAHRAAILENTIISDLQLIRRLSAELNRRSDRSMRRTNIPANIKSFNNHYFTSATGGAFQTADRLPSPQTVRELSFLYADATTALERLC